MKKNKNKFNGFTLIELLVVIGIIGILASFLMANFVGIRQRARDGVRKSDLRQIQSSLEMYRSDKGSYPPSLPACGSQFDDGGGAAAVVYMKKIPCDPSTEQSYKYLPSGSGYSLITCLENVHDSQADSSNNSSYCSGGSTNWSYTLQNP
jgi:general secretion pathway protein G